METSTVKLGPQTWGDAMPMLIALIIDGNDQGRKFASDELNRLAAVADRAIARDASARAATFIKGAAK